jgi:hypothetical protein
VILRISILPFRKINRLAARSYKGSCRPVSSIRVGYVVDVCHDRLGDRRGTACRYADFSRDGNELSVHFAPVRDQQGRMVATWVMWRHLSGEAEMLGNKK